ncbi:hypothetical protein BASA81_008699 [Batrachochytrium salamandrivorans]|nr:hypothetical protein BASA81_008699 [Batrachochytrium salamandrivorans]
MQVDFGLVTEEQIVFALSGVDVSFANALRRVMIAEVPSMAIEYVDIELNDSPMHDEVLAHRISLIPLRADAANFEPCLGRDDLDVGRNALEFTLDYTATAKNLQADGTCHVLSKHLQLVRQNKMEQDSSEEDEDEKVGMLLDDVMVMKLKPGQRLKLKCFAVRGLGAKHTKFSPVCTASYRSTPSVKLVREMDDKAHAKALVKLCPRGVFDIEDGLAIVANANACSMCRQCTIDSRFGSKYVELGRVPNSFIFSVETVGAIKPEEIFKRAVGIVKDKCQVVKQELANIEL